MPEDGSDGPRVANSDEQCKSDAGRHSRSRKASEEHSGRGDESLTPWQSVRYENVPLYIAEISIR